jgi:hypothetical protein
MPESYHSEDAARSQTEYYAPASLTHCAGTWLAHAPDDAEQQRIEAAQAELRQHRRLTVEFHQDPLAARRTSLELFGEPAFAPLHLADHLVEQIVAAVGEPPVVEDQNDPTFATYLGRAVLSIASSRVRRDMAAQLRRFVPLYAGEGRWKEAIAIDHNAFRTVFGHEATPFLVQMTFGGLLRWYEQREPGM